MKIAIAIFVKTPGITPLKTRLGSTIGQTKAEEFYIMSLDALQETISDLDLDLYWAVTEKDQIDNPLWSKHNRIYSNGGDLGTMQDHIYRTLIQKYDGVILIGSDSPQMSQELLSKVMKSLENNDYIIGPANDGGYYLLAGKKPISSKVWQSIPWSHEDTRSTLVSLLDSKPIEVDTLNDVDYESDLRAIANQMPDDINQSQEKIINWINNL